MCDILSEKVFPEELKQWEKIYFKRLYRREVTTDVKFDYAQRLVRSKHMGDVKKGVLFLEEIVSEAELEDCSEESYYLAFGYARLREYERALRCVKTVSEHERIGQLEQAIRWRMLRDELLNTAMAGGAMFVVSVLFGATLKMFRAK